MGIVVIIIGFILVLFISWRYLYFFRNPNRKIRYDDNHILSPADGYVSYVKRVEPGKEIFAIKKNNKILLDDLMFIDDTSLMQKSGWLIGITMTPFDIHYNRTPVRGKIDKIRHDFPGNGKKNKDMFPALQNLFFKNKPYHQDCEYIITNERASYSIKNEVLSVYVTQIADNWIRKIVTFKDNTEVGQGEVFGLIRMGSQVDLFIPDDNDEVRILIDERKHVKAGLSILATMDKH